MQESNTSILLFRRQKDWQDWLGANHATSSGAWLRLAKKRSAIQSVSYREALEAALCFGWIDAQKKGESEQAWLQRFPAPEQKHLVEGESRESRGAHQSGPHAAGRTGAG